jgi:hypothetical protein
MTEMPISSAADARLTPTPRSADFIDDDRAETAADDQTVAQISRDLRSRYGAIDRPPDRCDQSMPAMTLLSFELDDAAADRDHAADPDCDHDQTALAQAADDARL